ncbi:MAG: ABC transporter permease [Aggregatilineales bacterium]
MQKTFGNFRTSPLSRTVVPLSGGNNYRKWFRRFLPLVSFTVILVLWQAVTSFGLIESFLIPAPADVLETFVKVINDGTLLSHAQTTLYETLMGLTFGTLIGVTLGYLIARIPVLEAILSPVIVTFQSTPVVAYAPLLVLWFGTGTQSKVVTSILIVFFPMMMNTIVGIRGVPSDLHDLMRVNNASWRQTFLKLELPAAMPVLLTGLKTGATLAVIGAVVGEFVAARSGLGYMVKLATNQYNTPMMFVAVIALAIMAGGLYGIITLIEHRLLAWQHRGKHQ